MYKQPLFMLAIFCLILSSLTFANPPAGAGMGHGHGNNGKHGGFVTTAPGNTPPGLYKHGKYPHGLYKKGKVPHGWSKGKKEGWNKNHVVVPVTPVVPVAPVVTPVAPVAPVIVTPVR